MDPRNTPQPFTVIELAERWRVSKSHVYAKIESGELPAFKLGGSIRIPAAVVEEFETCAPNCIEDGITPSGAKQDRSSGGLSEHRTLISPSKEFRTFDAIGLTET